MVCKESKGMMKEISTHWGSDEYKDRESIIYHDTKKEVYVVEFWQDQNLVESRDMVDDGVKKSMRYAERAAENWVLGYIA